MGCALGHHVGGIAGLLTLERAQWEAVEADLLLAGFVLADVPHRVTWRAVKVLFAFAPRESAVFRLSGPEAHRWGDIEQLLALLVDLTQLRVWQQTKDAQSGRNRPKPIRRPWDPEPKRYGGGAGMTVTQLAAWSEARRRGEVPALPGRGVS